MLTAILFIVFSTGCRRPPVRTSVLEMSKTTRRLSTLLLRIVVLLSVSCATVSTSVLSASAAAAAFILSHLIFCTISCVMYFNFFFGGGFFYRDNNILISFLELGHFNVGVLGFFLVFNIHSRLVLFVSSPDMSILLGRVDQESSHNTSMVASHVDHVVGLSVFHVPQVSSLGQNVVDLFFLPFRETKDVCFSAFFLNIVLSAE